jgi:vitamin B12 transporter
VPTPLRSTTVLTGGLLLQATLAIALAALAPLALTAQDVRDTVELEELVITADRTPLPASRVVSPTTVIDGDQLRARGIRNVAEALRDVPGAMIVPTGSYGSQTSLFLRGGESDYVKVLVDGVPVNQPGGFFDFAHLTTDNVERIEVTRGPSSVLYGSDAVAGVVQVFTREGSGPFRGEASFRAGTFGTWAAEGTVLGGGATMSYSAGLARFSTGGIYDFNNDYRNTVASGGLTLRPDDRTDLTLTARTGDLTSEFPTDFTGAPVDRNSRVLQDGTTLGLTLGRRVSPALEVRAFLASHTQNDGSEDRPDNAADTLGFFASASQARLRRQSADVRATFTPSATARLTLGAAAEFESLREATHAQSNFGSGTSLSAEEFDANRRNIGLYGQAIVDVGPRLLLNLGARLDDNENFGAHATVRTGAIYRLLPATRLRASLGTGFKEPSLREHFARSAFEVGNPELDPERSLGWELGAEQSLLNGDVVLAATWFDQRFKDLIQYNGAVPPGESNYQNVAEASSRGLELEATMRPLPSTTLSASYTWLRTRVDDAGVAAGASFLEGRALLRRPAHTVRLDARTRIARRAGFGVTVQHVGERKDVDFAPFPAKRVTLDAYTLVDLDLSVDLVRGPDGRALFGTLFRAENLLDEEYVTVVGFPGRGRALQVGGRVGF